jgi:hypothetical protein
LRTLAEAEDKSTVSMPPVRRIGTAAVERELIAISVQAENARVATPDYNLFHGNKHPFLAPILQSQMRSDFSRTEL